MEITKKYIFDRNIDLMAWPARSPDLNPIENVWSVLAQKVYGECTQYDNVDDLRSGIEKALKEIDPDYLRTLVESVPHRAMKVLERKGLYTGY